MRRKILLSLVAAAACLAVAGGPAMADICEESAPVCGGENMHWSTPTTQGR